MKDIFIGFILGFVTCAMIMGIYVVKEINESTIGKFNQQQAQIEQMKERKND